MVLFSSAAFSQVMENVRLELSIPAVEPVQSSSDLDDELENHPWDVGRIIGVVFEHDALSPELLPDEVRYRIRFKNLNFDVKLLYGKEIQVRRLPLS